MAAASVLGWRCRRTLLWPWSSTSCFQFCCPEPRTRSITALMGHLRIESSTRAMSSLSQQVPVLIVGAGPVGLVLSILLAKFGVQSLVVDKRLQFSQHPQAHFINNRTMEIFRKLDGLTGQIESLQPPLEHWRKFIYCATLVGPVLGIVDHLQPHDLAHINSPTWVAHFSQHRLLALLLELAERIGLHIQDVGREWSPRCKECIHGLGQILLGWECTSIEETSQGIVARMASSGSGSECIVTSNFLVGADGAASSVRNLMDLKMEGECELQRLISIHFFSKELGQNLAQCRPGMLYFVFNAKAIGVVVAHDLRLGEFVVQLPFYPPQQHIEDFTDKVCKSIVCDLAGYTILDIEIKAVKPWVMHAQVAECYLSKKGQVILAGDAAHNFPPSGGFGATVQDIDGGRAIASQFDQGFGPNSFFGMNTGIQDAHNLAWKLAAVLNGIASPSLLCTYEAERRPIAQANTTLSVSNFDTAMSILCALGVDPSFARLVHRAVSSNASSFIPHGLQKSVLEGILALGRTQLSSLFLNKYNPVGLVRLENVKALLEEGRSLQLQFPAEDIGFEYKFGALVPETNPPEVLNTENLASRTNNYIQSCRPGVRLPHLDIAILNDNLENTNKEVSSTLDLTSIEKVQFLLVVGPNKSGGLWAKTFLHLAKSLDVTLKVVFMWPFGSSKALAGHCTLANLPGYLQQWRYMNKAFCVDVEMLSTDWWKLCQVPPIGAILVRPDDHVAWISRREYGTISLIELAKVFSSVLSKSISEVEIHSALENFII